MDRVRFGRALGYGARHAAKALAKAADAATTPTPPAARTANSTPVFSRSTTSSAAGGPPVAMGAEPRSAAPQGRASAVPGSSAQAPPKVRQNVPPGRRLRRHLWSPLAHFSGVVWLQVSGTFFALIALFLSQGLWKQRAALHLPLHSPEAGKLYLHAAAFAIFAYFAVSSFVRAQLKQRR